MCFLVPYVNRSFWGSGAQTFLFRGTLGDLLWFLKSTWVSQSIVWASLFQNSKEIAGLIRATGGGRVLEGIGPSPLKNSSICQGFWKWGYKDDFPEDANQRGSQEGVPKRSGPSLEKISGYAPDSNLIRIPQHLE